MNTTPAAVCPVLADLLEALGFEAMARDVLAETDPARLRRYARVIANGAKGRTAHAAIVDRLRLLGLI